MRSYCHFTRWACSGALIRYSGQDIPDVYSWSSAELSKEDECFSSFHHPFWESITLCTRCLPFCANLCLQVAVDNNDPQMCDFIESEFLTEQVCSFETVDKLMHHTLIVRCNTFKPSLPGNGQTISRIPITKTSGACTSLTFVCTIVQVEAIKKVSTYVSQLRRVGKGHGKFTIFSRTYWIDIFGEPLIVLNMSEWARPIDAY